LTTVFRLLLPEVAPLLAELKTQFLQEFDYRRELLNLKRMKANLTSPPLPYKLQQRHFTAGFCEIPEPVGELCTDKVLVFRFLPGLKVESALRALGQGTGPASMTEINRRLMGKDGQSSDGASSSSPRSAFLNSSLLLDWLPVLLYVRRMFHFLLVTFPFLRGASDSEAGSGGRHDGSEDQQQKDLRALQKQASAVVDRLVKLHGEQLFYHGFFQGDPHPGNFLLRFNDKAKGEQNQNESDFTLGLLDFGQCKELTLADRLRLARLILAVADDRGEEIVRILREEYGIQKSSGASSEDWFLEKVARFAFGELNSRLTDGGDLREFSKKLAEHYQDQVLPGELYLPMRTSIMLRGLGLLLNCYVSPAELWREMAVAVLEHEV